MDARQFRFFSCTILLCLAAGSAEQYRLAHLKDVVGEHGTALLEFAKTFPLENPENCLRMIKASARNQEDKEWMCETIMYMAEDNQKSEVYFRHLDGFNTLFGARNDSMKAKINFHRGKKYYDLGVYDTAIAYMNKSLAYYQNTGKEVRAAEIMRAVARAYGAKGDYYSETDYALRGWEAIKSSLSASWRDRSYALSELGGAFIRQKNYAKAVETLWLVVPEVRLRNEVALVETLQKLSEAYAGLGQTDSAFSLASQAKQLAVSSTGTSTARNLLLASTDLRLGVAYKLQGACAKAVPYLERSLRQFDSMDIKKSAPYTCAQLAYSLQTLGDYSGAAAWYDEALRRSGKAGNAALEAEIKDSLAVFYAIRIGVPAISVRFREALAFKDSVNNVRKQDLIENLNLKYETALREERIRELQNARLAARVQSILGFSLLVMALLVIVFLVDNFRKRRALLQQENLMNAAREERSRAELELARQTLATFEKNIRSKERLIEDMEARLAQPVSLATDAETELGLGKEFWNEKKLLTEDDWQEYLQYFGQVYPAFIKRVKTTYSQMTEGELRLFLLIRQGFTGREIERILGITNQSYRKSRYRLRKRLDVQDENYLNETIRVFG